MRLLHGHARELNGKTAATPEYNCWTKMRSRCKNPNNPRFHRYGGRGIRVCERWQSFPNFIADMGLRPSSRHSIERVDVNGHYEPGNCRWATHEDQTANKQLGAKRLRAILRPYGDSVASLWKALGL